MFRIHKVDSSYTYFKDEVTSTGHAPGSVYVLPPPLSSSLLAHEFLSPFAFQN